jgi:hypothetical protein
LGDREFAIENVVAPHQQSRGASFGKAAIAEDLRFNVQAVELVARNGNCMITRGQAELASYRWDTVRVKIAAGDGALVDQGALAIAQAIWNRMFAAAGFGLGTPGGVTAGASRNLTAAEIADTNFLTPGIDAPNRGRGGNVTIINPPGTPAAYVDGTRIYQRRNGNTIQ